MIQQEHRVTVRIGTKAIERWHGYTVDCDMLTTADAFSLSFASGKREVWDLCKPDSAVQVLIDDTVIVTGFIDDRSRSVDEGGSHIDIRGRDKGGRLVDESMPLFSFAGLDIVKLAARCVEGWFPRVVMGNKRNRALVRGHAANVANARDTEPTEIKVHTGAAGHTKVNPGESRWQVLEYFLKEAELLAWSSADGEELIIGLPNYSQEAQYRFFQPAENSARQREGNILSWSMTESVGERYAKITAIGAGHGDEANYGAAVTKRRGVVLDNPADPRGLGRAFTHPKALILANDSVSSPAVALKKARREMDVRNASGQQLSLIVAGHSQIYGGRPVLYAFDTMAEFEDEETGVRGRYLLTKVTFSHTLDAGETTAIVMVPEGTVLKL